MELQTAIQILEYHQEWRLGKREDMIHEPKKVTEALDIVLIEVKKVSLGGVSGQLPDFLYEDEGQIKIGYYGDTVVTDEWNKWKEGNLR